MLLIIPFTSIGIRRFISQLEADGKLYERYKRYSYLHSIGRASEIPESSGRMTPETEDGTLLSFFLSHNNDPYLTFMFFFLSEYLWDEEVSPLSDDYRAFPTQSPAVSPSAQRRTSFIPRDAPSINPTTKSFRAESISDDDEPLINMYEGQPLASVLERSVPAIVVHQEAALGDQVK